MQAPVLGACIVARDYCTEVRCLDSKMFVPFAPVAISAGKYIREKKER